MKEFFTPKSLILCCFIIAACVILAMGHVILKADAAPAAVTRQVDVTITLDFDDILAGYRSLPPSLQEIFNAIKDDTEPLPPLVPPFKVSSIKRGPPLIDPNTLERLN